MPKKQSGFTMVELLVVITIIGFLSTLVLNSLGQARLKARDSRRLADINSLYTAIYLYYENNYRYPCVQDYYTEGTFDYAEANIRSDEAEWHSCLGQELEPYLKEMPLDPKSNTDPFVYAYRYRSFGEAPGLYVEYMLEKPTGSLLNSPTRGGYHYFYYEQLHD
ncbi:MAG TPA: type II secretion system protein [Candidatus Wirthbacteria bacterium]|nr:type II secretion system protein [Candidatus Wirthbacteria bacterium]